MMVLALGVVVFAALHLVPAIPPLKQRLKAAIGDGAYGPVYGIASIVALGLIVVGWRRSDFVAVYDPPSWGAHANFLFTLVAFICLGVFLFRGSLRQKLRFPATFLAMLRTFVGQKCMRRRFFVRPCMPCQAGGVRASGTWLGGCSCALARRH